MKTLKLWIKTERGKTIFVSLISIFSTAIIVIAILLPIFLILLNNPSTKGMMIAYNRDSSSGSRDAFESAINFDPDNQVFSPNVLTVSGNDDMLNKVKQNPNSIGYVTFATAIEYNEDTNMYEEIPGINILDFNGVDLIESSQINNPNASSSDILMDYDAKRYFNLFFRVDEQYNNLIYNNLYINKTSQNNLWTEGGEFIDVDNEYNSLKAQYEVNDSKSEQQLLFSFLYFNYLLFSPSITTEEIPLRYEQISDNSDFDASYEIFLGNVNTLNPTLLIPPTNNSQIDIYTVGSTSVQSTQTLTNPLFINDTNQILINNGMESLPLFFQSANVGSADAFKDDPPSVSSHVWLGFQSRSPKDSEQALYNQAFIPTESNAYDIDDNFVYGSFEIDALAFIVSDSFTFNADVDGETIQMIPTNITSLGMNLIYTNNFNFNKLYGLEQVDGVPVN